ncbi:histidyl-tRNA synthetase [compost metagenome]
MSEKLRYAESVGIPYAILIGNNFLKTGKYEVKNRKTGEVLELTPEETTNFFNKIHEQFDEAFYYGF